MALIGPWDSPERPAAVSPWSLMHLATGVFAYAAYAAFFPHVAAHSGGPGLLAWFMVHLAYEGKDVYRSYWASPRKELAGSWQNSAGDQAVAVLGYLLGARLRVGLVGGTLAVVAAYLVLASPLALALERQSGRQRPQWALSPRDVWTSRG